MLLREQFGDIDIYLFDQLLRGRIRHGMRIVDAGCGAGRNLVYLLREGHDVFGADEDAGAIDRVSRLAQELAPQLPSGRFLNQPIEAMTFPDAFADVVISSAVLHFARDDAHFDGMVRGTWRVLKPEACSSAASLRPSVSSTEFRPSAAAAAGCLTALTGTSSMRKCS